MLVNGGIKPEVDIKYWTDITEKDEYEKVNLAIVRLKEEYDFIDNELVKYIIIFFGTY